MQLVSARLLIGAVATAGLAAGLLSATPGAQASVGTHGAVEPQAAATSFVSYRSFIKETSQARYQSYASAGRTGGVRGARAFSQMRSYILNTYRGTQVRHSFDYDGIYFDCVTISSQPTVRELGIKTIATPPPASTQAAHHTGRALAPLLTQGLKDAYGNAISCPSGTIPMRRMTLSQMTKFPTLAAYLSKTPYGKRAAGPGITPGGPHRYAYGYQYVTNYGGNSWLNVWNPSGNFTLSQQWYVNGSGSGTQTVEGGWVNYPAEFGSQSVLFIFSTPNDYASGCYNLQCAGFVQTTSAAALGAPFSNYSSYGGTQYGFGLQWKYYDGNWWMFYQNNAVGYYPGSVFNGGPMGNNSALTEYGGETYTPSGGWPQMGSGKFASAGWTQAAFQNTIFYIPQNVSGGTGVWSSLTPVETNPDCYTIAYTSSANGGSWGTYFYFGGPGGNC
jgi:Neprosin